MPICSLFVSQSFPWILYGPANRLNSSWHTSTSLLNVNVERLYFASLFASKTLIKEMYCWKSDRQLWGWLDAAFEPLFCRQEQKFGFLEALIHNCGKIFMLEIFSSRFSRTAESILLDVAFSRRFRREKGADVQNYCEVPWALTLCIVLQKADS